jgi:dolichol kinase
VLVAVLFGISVICGIVELIPFGNVYFYMIFFPYCCYSPGDDNVSVPLVAAIAAWKFIDPLRQ